MKLSMQLASFVFLASTASFAAGSWSGYMVDSNCYETRRRNVNPWSTSNADRDMDADIKSCTPKAKTKSFALVLVQQDWKMFKFDSAGNAKATELVHHTAKQRVFRVTIAGEIDRDILRVDSISMAK